MTDFDPPQSQIVTFAPKPDSDPPKMTIFDPPSNPDSDFAPKPDFDDSEFNANAKLSPPKT